MAFNCYRNNLQTKPVINKCSFLDIARLKVKIISESSVYSWVDCGTSCLQTRFCVAYNYKENSKGNEVNCQLTAATDHQFEKGRKGDNGWSFYEGVDERKVILIMLSLFIAFRDISENIRLVIKISWKSSLDEGILEVHIEYNSFVVVQVRVLYMHEFWVQTAVQTLLGQHRGTNSSFLKHILTNLYTKVLGLPIDMKIAVFTSGFYRFLISCMSIYLLICIKIVKQGRMISL